MSSVPLSLSPSAWWAFAGDIAVVLVVGLVCFGFYAARTGQPLFGALTPRRVSASRAAYRRGGFFARAVGGAVHGSSGHGCFG